jgi:hypothetical protein
LNIQILTMLALLVATSSASASADTSAKPGGVYRLKPGIYVARGASCASPANAEIRQYDGRGISTAHTSACSAKIRTRKGTAYTVDQTCLDVGAGPGKKFVERQKVTVSNALTSNQAIGKESTTYRYCAPDELPVDLQKAAKQVRPPMGR